MQKINNINLIFEYKKQNEKTKKLKCEIEFTILKRELESWNKEFLLINFKI